MEPLYTELRTIGRYSLLSRIASGGMGEIYLARLTSTQGVERYVAIKLLLPQFTEEKSVVDLFVTEARIAARIQHPNVCQVYELGTANDELFICMEFLQGVPVSAILQTHNANAPIPVGIAAAIVEQACAGLEFAHRLKDENGKSLGVVHRDISPGNLFLTSNGVTKVLDFGVVKANDKAVKTQTGVLMGKMGYMSPEQIKGDTVDCRSDIFSLGIVLFELLTNRRLFSRESEYYTLKAILEEPVTKLREWSPHFSTELEAVVSKALSQDVNKRFSSMSEFSDALNSAMRKGGGLASTSEIKKFVHKNYSEKLGEVEELLRYANAPSECEPEDETKVCRAPEFGEPRIKATKEVEISQTAPVNPLLMTSPPKSHAVLGGMILLGVAIMSLALVLFLKKDKEATAPQAIVFEGNISREQGAAQVSRTIDAGVQVAVTDVDAGIERKPRGVSCADKPSAKARNSCHVTRKGGQLQTCLQKHALTVSGTPRLTLDFFLDSRGKIKSVDVTPASIGKSALGKCVKQVASSIRFGKQAGNVKFSVPLRIN